MLHPCEVDLSDLKALTKYSIEAAQLGKKYHQAILVQAERQGVIVPPEVVEK